MKLNRMRKITVIIVAKKSKLSKALDISLDVRKKVYERSGGKCETCGDWCDDMGYSNSHYISRGRLGLGIEQNILHQCYECHYAMDHKGGEEHFRVMEKAKAYLMNYYDDWNEDDLIYRKGI